jgi:hypothetical protein
MSGLVYVQLDSQWVRVLDYERVLETPGFGKLACISDGLLTKRPWSQLIRN